MVSLNLLSTVTVYRYLKIKKSGQTHIDGYGLESQVSSIQNHLSSRHDGSLDRGSHARAFKYQ